MADSEAYPTPRQAAIGKVADALAKTKQFLNIDYGGPQIGEGVLGQSPEVLDDMSYGKLPITGSGATTNLDPKALDLLNLLPVDQLAAIGYHGSSNLFKAFSDAFIGLGKGAYQGPGHYFTEKLRTAQAYGRDAVRDLLGRASSDMELKHSADWVQANPSEQAQNYRNMLVQAQVDPPGSYHVYKAQIPDKDQLLNMKGTVADQLPKYQPKIQAIIDALRANNYAAFRGGEVPQEPWNMRELMEMLDLGEPQPGMPFGARKTMLEMGALGGHYVHGGAKNAAFSGKQDYVILRPEDINILDTRTYPVK